MRLSPAVMATVVAMTVLFALFFLFSICALITLFHPLGFSYGKEYFERLLTQYVASAVFAAIGLTVGTIVLYKSKER